MIDDEIVAALEEAGLKSGAHYVIQGGDLNADVPGNEFRVIEPQGNNHAEKLENQHKVRDALNARGGVISQEIEDEGQEALMVRRTES